MMVPTIHLNGTSPEELSRQLCAAATALLLAIDALNKASPNGRDYYPQGPDAFNTANTEHLARVKRLHAVLNEIDGVAKAINATARAQRAAAFVVDRLTAKASP